MEVPAWTSRPSLNFAFIETFLTIRFRLPFLLSLLAGYDREMPSMFFLLAALPLASFALTINHVDYGVDDTVHGNETMSSEYWLQDSYESDSFFEYAVCISLFLC